MFVVSRMKQILIYFQAYQISFCLPPVTYREFHRFVQVKFAYGGLPIYTTTTPAAFKNDAQFESGQNQLKTNHLASLIKIRDTLCMKFFKIKTK